MSDHLLPWLLDSDPGLRWQVMRDFTDASPVAIAAERARVATEGHGAALLAQQGPDGRWGGAAWNRGFDSTMHVLMLLRDLGLDPVCAEARHALGLVREHVTWTGCGPPECDGHRFFAGETEPCINAQVAAVGAYFGQDVGPLVERLLGEQLADGGWNCEAERGATSSSFNTTVCVLEALLAFERAVGGSVEAATARRRGEEYLLERRLCRRRSTGELIERCRKSGTSFTRFVFPTWWHYDVLRGLDLLREAGRSPEERMSEAFEAVAQAGAGGRWPRQEPYPGRMPVELEAPGSPASRWISARALRVLGWRQGVTTRVPSPSSLTPPASARRQWR